ncbi:hypothetical protein ACFE04_021566 [Oxalis oulophora]
MRYLGKSKPATPGDTRTMGGKLSGWQDSSDEIVCGKLAAWRAHWISYGNLRANAGGVFNSAVASVTFIEANCKYISINAEKYEHAYSLAHANLDGEDAGIFFDLRLM